MADTLDDMDVGAAINDISADLFPAEEEASSSKSPSEASTDRPETSPNSLEVAEESAAKGAAAKTVEDPREEMTPAEIKAMPRSWKKEMESHWGKLPKEVHDYVYEREANVMRGIQQYQEGYKSWDTLIKPFAPVFEQHRDVNPVQLMQNLMNTHLKLLTLPDDQKVAEAQRIFQSYGIDPTKLGAQGVSDPRIGVLERQLQEARTWQQNREAQEYQNILATQTEAVNKFADDKKNKYFSEVAVDVLKFIQTGAAADLPAAYELACYSNPAVRAKIIAEQQLAVPSVPGRKAPNLDGSGEGTPRRRKPGSIDDTINSVIAKNYAQH